MDKAQILSRFSGEPDRYYTVDTFADRGFERRSCRACGRFFWTLDPSREHCPDHGRDTYSFIGEPPTARRFDYTESWRQIESFFTSNGHASIPRYPVVCRWRDDLYYTIASIVDFQRVMGSKVVFEFPANPLVVPQTCLRFKDMEYVGVSGRHFSSFCMVGQHAVPDTGGYWKDECIRLDYDLLTSRFGIDPVEITFVEDVWVGGGSFGPSLEYFVRGLELGNAVFTEFQGTLEEHTTLDRRIIDMGAGLERFAWITMGTPTAYDCCFGPVLGMMMENAGVDSGGDLIRSYYIEVARGLEDAGDINHLRRTAAARAGLTDGQYRSQVAPLESIYMVADHIRTLIFAVSDGSLPSNVGGGYNLRMMIRRIAGALDSSASSLDMHEMVERQIDYLAKTYPELDGRRADVRTILDIEMARYRSSQGRMARIADRVRGRDGPPTIGELLTLYESDGITPDYLVEAGAISQVPPDFYPRLSELHQRRRPGQEAAPDLDGIPQTVPLYYRDDPGEFTATVLSSSGGVIILDRTSFYPRGGGQEPDTGTIARCRITDVQKHGGVILHHIQDGDAPPEAGRAVVCRVDADRRRNITRNHTATHILNASSRRVLGSWVWQHSAYKDEDHARLDVTHHSALTAEEVSRIQQEANGIIAQNLPVSITYMDRGTAESRYGFSIYQGGVVPVKSVRIVSIGDGTDVEACGGTHVQATGEVGLIRITRARRIQDGVVRLEFVAGEGARRLAADQDIARGDDARPARQDDDDGDRQKQERRQRAREVISGMLPRIISGEGSEDGISYRMGACLAHGDAYDEYFHVQMGKRLTGRHGAAAYCGIFRSGPAVRVMVYCGKDSPYKADSLAGMVSGILGGRAAGDDSFAQGGGRGVSSLDEAIARIKSEMTLP